MLRKDPRSLSPTCFCEQLNRHCLVPAYQPKSDTMSLHHQSILRPLRFVKPSHSSLPIVKPPYALSSLSWILRKPRAFILYLWITRRYTQFCNHASSQRSLSLSAIAIAICRARRPRSHGRQPQHPCHRQIKTIISRYRRCFPRFGDHSILDRPMLEIFWRQKLQYI